MRRILQPSFLLPQAEQEQQQRQTANARNSPEPMVGRPQGPEGDGAHVSI
jgi:hypothetical protein